MHPIFNTGLYIGIIQRFLIIYHPTFSSCSQKDHECFSCFFFGRSFLQRGECSVWEELNTKIENEEDEVNSNFTWSCHLLFSASKNTHYEPV